MIVGKSNLIILLFAYSIFQIPIFLITAITIIPIKKNYKIFFLQGIMKWGNQ